MQHGLKQQGRAVHSGHWPLIRYNPEVRASGENPFSLDSQRPTIPLKDYTGSELRYRMLSRTNPDEARMLMDAAQNMVDQKWKLYEEMAALEQA
jgi:pyruvate-ferredoxin/flavodoxin oxidoreductase